MISPLKKLVLRISAVIRADTEWRARDGGEEFGSVLPETQLGNASGLAERLRRNIAKTSIETQENKISITASFGVTGFNSSNPPKNITPEALIHMADKYLYAAKNQGRNKVISGSFEG